MDEKSKFYGCIYGLRSISGKWYIGQTTQNVKTYIKNHYEKRNGGDRIKIARAIQKYGFSSFEVKIFVYLLDKDSLDKAEVGFIEMYNSIENGYNCRDGGSSGEFSEESRNKMSMSHIGHKHTEESKEKIRKNHSRFNKGRKFSDEFKFKNRNSHIKYEYSIQKLDGSIIKVTSMSEFCKNNNLSKATMCRLGQCNGFTCLSRRDLNTNEILLSKKKDVEQPIWRLI